MLKRLFGLLLVGFLCRAKADTNAYDNDINRCLFTGWTTASGNSNAVLKEAIKCPGRDKAQLCYGPRGNPPVAQFAVCYNKLTLTPDFTGHIVVPNIQSGGGRESWHDESGTYAPSPQSKFDDYKVEFQSRNNLYDNLDERNEHFLSRGHLTPNADFTSATDREMTMVNTNIAPQWQRFNGKNWAILEKAVRTYATAVNRDIYVFTGVSGKARDPRRPGEEIKLAGGEVTPQYYWKAICDPGHGSIVFWGENSVGVASTESVQGCNGRTQTKRTGVIYCCSLQNAATKGFALPPFNDNCRPTVKADFMNDRLNDLE